jgi:hypothetical protein
MWAPRRSSLTRGEGITTTFELDDAAGALDIRRLACSQLVDMVSGADAKFFQATQVMDEAQRVRPRLAALGVSLPAR